MNQIKFLCYADGIDENHIYFGKKIDPKKEQYSITSLIKGSRQKFPANEAMLLGTQRHDHIQKILMLEDHNYQKDEVVISIIKQLRKCTNANDFSCERKMVFEYKDIYITGSVDLESRKNLIEIKTGQERPTDTEQLGFYLYLTKLINGVEKKGYVVYQNKSTPVFLPTNAEEKIITLLETLIEKENTEEIKVEDDEIVDLYGKISDLKTALKTLQEELDQKVENNYSTAKKYSFGSLILEHSKYFTKRVDTKQISLLPENIKKDLYKSVETNKKTWRNLDGQ